MSSNHNRHNAEESSRDQNNESQSAQLGHNLNSYIRNLDVANVLAADLASINQSYIDPSIAAAAYKRATTDDQRNEGQISDKTGYGQESNDNEDDIDGEDFDQLMPPLPPGADAKKMCPFCQRTFSHPGSMGRHLDLKKGTDNHPADLITKMRAGVKRRGDVEKIKERRRIRAKKYNSRIDVKERSKVKRRVRERVQRARKIAINKFTINLNKPELSYQPTFPRLVLYFLPPNQWPHDPPTLETYRSLCEYLNAKFLNNPEISEEQSVSSTQYYDDIMQKVHNASENWLTLSEDSKTDIWLREIRKAAEDALTNTSLFDLANRENWVTEQAKKTIQNEFKGEDDQDESVSERDENNTPQGMEQNNDDDEANERQRNSTNYYDHDDLTAVAEAVINNHGQSSQ